MPKLPRARNAAHEQALLTDPRGWDETTGCDNTSALVVLPSWLTEAREKVEYQLGMHNGNCLEERIDLTHNEYVMLKCHLAQLRGFEVDSETALSKGIPAAVERMEICREVEPA